MESLGWCQMLWAPFKPVLTNLYCVDQSPAGAPLKGSFWLSGVWWGQECCAANKLPGQAHGADWDHSLSNRNLTSLVPLLNITTKSPQKGSTDCLLFTKVNSPLQLSVCSHWPSPAPSTSQAWPAPWRVHGKIFKLSPPLLGFLILAFASDNYLLISTHHLSFK